jgi:hypothetical protein
MDFPNVVEAHIAPPAISVGSPLCAVGDLLALAGIAATTGGSLVASTAFLYPFLLPQDRTITKITTVNGTTVSGNVDVGIYDEQFARVVSAGSTAQGATGIQVFDVADTFMKAGTYYLAIVADNITGLYNRATGLVAAVLRTAGVVQMATAFPLPSTITPAAMTSAIVPAMSAHFVTAV